MRPSPPENGRATGLPTMSVYQLARICQSVSLSFVKAWRRRPPSVKRASFHPSGTTTLTRLGYDILLGHVWDHRLDITHGLMMSGPCPPAPLSLASASSSFRMAYWLPMASPHLALHPGSSPGFLTIMYAACRSSFSFTHPIPPPLVFLCLLSLSHFCRSNMQLWWGGAGVERASFGALTSGVHRKMIRV